jgi:hypothetical protein
VGSSFWPGRRSQFRQLKNDAQSEGWAFTRNLVFLVFAKDGISHVKCVTKKKSSLCSDRQLRPVSSPPCP